MRARTMEEFRDMIRQGLLEVEELRQAADFDEESAGVPAYTDGLQRDLEALQTAAADEDYAFGGDSLACAALLDQYDHTELPFRYLLERIVRTHSQGLDADGTERAGLEEVSHAH